jgi:hypothetical protein
VAALPGGGYLYVDYNNDLVREVSPAGIVTTVAGNGSTTDTDGTLAVNSGLDGPVSVAPLPNGGFLITEYNGSRVRIVSAGSPATATITTIAGTGTPGDNGQAGPGTSIELNYPTDAEPTADGQVLIADTYNDVVRILSAASPLATISTIAGGGSCDDVTASCQGLAADAVQLNQPISVSPIAGGAGGYLLAEYGGAAIRQISGLSPTGTFTTVAGIGGEPGFAGDGGPATAAELDHPEQVVSTADGGFLIADTNNERIRQVSAAGTITTVAGNGVPSYAGDGGAATAASLQRPSGISATSAGGFLIADADNNLIRRVTIPPVTTINLNPSKPNGDNGWYVSSVQATSSATEKAQTRCELDPSVALTVFDEIPAGCSYSGAGASITGDGTHMLYAASVNSFGDKEIPVSVTLKIDVGPPTVLCPRSAKFRAGSPGSLTAGVTDSISGPSSPQVSTPVNTSRVGRRRAVVTASNNAGVSTDKSCAYTVVPGLLHPAPGLRWRFLSHGSSTVVGRLVIDDVPAQAAVNLACRGRGCPFAAVHDVTGKMCHGTPCRAGKPRRGARSRALSLAGLFSGASLARGADLTVSVTQPGKIGRVWLFRIRAGQAPAHQVSCLEPGSSVPGRGCAASH